VLGLELHCNSDRKRHLTWPFTQGTDTWIALPDRKRKELEFDTGKNWTPLD